MEAAFQAWRSDSACSPLVLPLAHDALYEANVATREFYPIYWDGQTFEIRRGIWFEPGKGPSAYVPCDENLTAQLEDGLRKFHDLSRLGTLEGKALDEWRWPLLGPHLNHFVSFADPTVAWLQTDELASKIQRAIAGTKSGTKLFRGWHELQATLNKQSSSNSIKKEPSIEEDGRAVLVKDSPQSHREIRHIVFAIHGIGQKLSRHLEAMSFINDCDTLRNGIKDAHNHLHQTSKAAHDPSGAAEPTNTVPEECGIQVLPIHWRQKMKVEIPTTADESDDELDTGLTLGDILPEGIPGIRMLVSD
ncbi:hypothetical protein HDU91_004267, partial [Kappamyces sp. JEL0680]